MHCSRSGFPVLHHLLEFAQTHIYWVDDAIQLSHPLLSPLLLPSILPSIRVSSNESALHIRWPKYWSFSISPSNEYSGLLSFRIGLISLLSKGLSRAFSNTTVRKHQSLSISGIIWRYLLLLLKMWWPSQPGASYVNRWILKKNPRVSVSTGYHNKNHTLGSSENRKQFSHRSGKSIFKEPSDWVSGEKPLPSLPPSHCVLTLQRASELVSHLSGHWPYCIRAPPL